MDRIYCGRKKKEAKKKAPVLGASIICAVICAFSLVLFSAGDREVTAFASESTDKGFWDSYAEFMAGIFGYDQ